MAISKQRLMPGRLKAAFEKEMARLAGLHAIEKLWAKDPSLWNADEVHARVIRNRLGWIGILDAMRAEAVPLTMFAREIRQSGFRDVVLLGMGGSSLAPEVFSLVFPLPDECRFFVLDSTDPASVLGVERGVDLRRTLFIVASKSGKTIETLSQFQYFIARVRAADVEPPGANFIAITDQGSHLDRLAADHGFRHTFRNAADIGGRYSALSYFGLLPAALSNIDLEAVLSAALEMREACGPAPAAANNPALALGALLGVAAENGADKVALLSTASLASLGNWIEQLVAESTGKEGKGIAPIAGETPGALSSYGDKAVVVALALEREDRRALDAALAPLAGRGIPVVDIRLDEREQLGAEFFKWEVATAVAAAVLRVDPFDEPNVTESKDITARILDAFRKSGRMPAAPSMLKEAGIELHGGEAITQQSRGGILAGALRTFLAGRRPGDYLALLAYVDRNEANARRLAALRSQLRDGLRLPVLVGYGPRYLHSIGQLYKGGPPAGLFLMITAADAEDAAVPGAGYTFGQLKMAQALGDLEALAGRGKPAMRLHLAQGAEAGLARLQKAFEEALGAEQRAGL